METFVVGRTGWAFVNLTKSLFRTAYPRDEDFLAQYPDAEIHASDYTTAGFDQLRIVMNTLEQAHAVLRDNAVVQRRAS